MVAPRPIRVLSVPLNHLYAIQASGLRSGSPSGSGLIRTSSESRSFRFSARVETIRSNPIGVMRLLYACDNGALW